MFYFHMRNVPIGLRSCIIRASNLFIVLVGHFFGGLKHDARLQNRSSICTMPGRKFFQPEWGGGMLLETGQKILGLLIYVVLVKDTCRILCGALVLPPSDHLENHILRLAISIFKVIRLWYTG